VGQNDGASGGYIDPRLGIERHGRKSGCPPPSNGLWMKTARGIDGELRFGPASKMVPVRTVNLPRQPLHMNMPAWVSPPILVTLSTPQSGQVTPFGQRSASM
jgi:hypothetical protein